MILIEQLRELATAHGVSTLLELLAEIVQDDACLYIDKCKKARAIPHLDRVADYNSLGRRLVTASKAAGELNM